MIRLLIPLLMLTFTGAAHALDTASLNGSVPGNRRITYLYEIDFGGVSQSWTANVSLNTNASTGLAINLIDVDALAASSSPTPSSIDTAVVTAPGTASATLNGSYAGVRCFAIEIETALGTTASDYDGTLTINTGTIVSSIQDQFVKTATGLRLSVGKFAFWDGNVPSGKLIAQSLQLDFGPSTHTEFFRFEAIGSGIEKIELIDTTGGSATILATFTNPTSGDITAVPITHSGKATLRINVKANVGATGTASWGFNAPCSVKVSLVGNPGEGGSNDCSTSEGSNSTLLYMLALGVVALGIRLRPATTDQ